MIKIFKSVINFIKSLFKKSNEDKENSTEEIELQQEEDSDNNINDGNYISGMDPQEEETENMKAQVKYLVPIIQKWEGGFSNHPSDTGGATMAGITIATYKSYCKIKGKPVPTVEDLKNITQEEWMDILKTLYWDKWQADDINNQSIANLIVDWVWASGVYGIKYPQQVLGVTADGIVGPKTLAAINDYANQEELFNKLWERRKQHFEAIVANNASQQVFLKGWLNRLNDFVYHADNKWYEENTK